MAPIPLHLPTIDSVLPHLSPNHVLGKRDWRHGFHQLTLHPSSRKYMAFRTNDGRICRFKALPFGASQAPALFTLVANEFARLLAARLQSQGLQKFLLAVYVDDVLISAPTFQALLTLKTAMDALANDLGIEFKSTKDIGFEHPCYTLEFLGI